ncbi:HAMP domain-containing protein [Metasolibacillus meyeri]|uniref:HAMP domain-containing protein n=1 Tax=Metasolibacillus meyeri TaxID=1071052 RepID=UPI00187D53B0|nr:HAMP domain-containing protein [Metasolibacillus meyeri]
MNEWMKKWLMAILFCLFLIVGCGIYLFVDGLNKDKEAEAPYVINPVRVKVNDLLLYIEQHYHDLEHDSNVRNALQTMSINQGIDILISRLDGKVSFNSSQDSSAPYIDIRNDLHYDLYTAKVEADMFNIAFPVMDEETQTQVGNVIFTIDKNSVLTDSSHLSTNYSIMIVMILLTIILIGLLCMMSYKCRVDIIHPIQKLKKSTEEILKGNYEQPTAYMKNDEIGEVYAVFEQMRIEIMELSIQRDEQEKNHKKLISSILHDIKTPLTTK